MDEAAIPGQARGEAVRLLARAARALADDGACDTEQVLAAYRAARPSGHAGAAADEVDAAFVARMRALGGDLLLGATRLRVLAAPWRRPWRVSAADDGAAELHAAPQENLAGDALLLLAGLALEAAKLAHGLPAAPDALRAAFATPQTAKDALEALRLGGSARVVELSPTGPRVDTAALAALVGDRPCYLVTGDGAARVHDLLSPFARRLRAPLTALGERAEPRPPRDELVYAGIERLIAADPAALDERLAAERADGHLPVGPGAVAVRCEALPDAEVDRRCREAAVRLKRARALLVVVEPSAGALEAALQALGRAVRAGAIVSSGTTPCVPTMVHDAASGHLVPVDNALGNGALPARASSLVSLPSLALAGDEPDRDATTFPLVQAVLRARADGVLDPQARLAAQVVPAGDQAALSTACLALLAHLSSAGRAPAPSGRARRR
ncbi:MAG: hypothetical protein HYS27_13785 [Deltaproteobacteria bacterium]|nr:hypothetical protein [Deltaproteobacteria bacterium]